MSYKRNYSNEEILAGLKDGNRLVENYFFDRLKERAFGIFCRRPTGSWEYMVMEECLSNSFLILQKKIRSGAYHDQNLEAFALGIIRNSYWDGLRKWRRKTFTDIATIQDGAEEKSDLDIMCIVSLFEKYNNLQLTEWGRQLSDRNRRIFDMQLQGYSLKEIAKELGVAYGSIRNICSSKIREAKKLAKQQDVRRLSQVC